MLWLPCGAALFPHFSQDIGASRGSSFYRRREAADLALKVGRKPDNHVRF
jgi:hypothetical protein